MTATTASENARGFFPRQSSILPGICFSLLAACLSLRAASTFYIDSDWTGAQNGTASEPWNSMNSPPVWSAINSALAAGGVTVCFSARQAAADADKVYDTDGDGSPNSIDVTMRTDTGGNVLTLDGQTQYNTSDTAPSWAPYSGASKQRILYLNGQSTAHIKFSNITIHGFHVITTDGNKEMAICGDNWIVENCECQHAAGATDGPGILIVPTANNGHEGSVDYAPVCTNIVIRNNVVHDTYGEAIYIGGGGVMDGTAGAGYPSHSHITIESNVVYNAGTWGGQGDGIDVKGGITYLTIRANEIYNINSTFGARAIVLQGQTPGASQTTVIERNRIHDCQATTDAALVLVDNWGTPQGATIQNNVIYNVKAGGILIYNSQDTVGIYNNTVAASSFLGIVSLGKVSVMNNLVFGNNGERAQVAFVGGAAHCDNNAFTGDWGYSPAGASSLSLSTNDLINTVTSIATGDFTLKPGSPVIGKGKRLTSFTNDVVARARGAFWDIGAYQHTSSVSGPPRPPTGLRIIAQPQSGSR